MKTPLARSWAREPTTVDANKTKEEGLFKEKGFEFRVKLITRGKYIEE